MGNKKYQVFISSTYTDLIEERRKVLDILLMADCIPAGMEAFVATDNEQFEVIKKVIDLCDYYVLIIGKRYGSINPTTGISYTEMEYEYAKEKGIPVLVFAIDDSVVLEEDKCESDEDKQRKLKTFKEKALTNRMASIWHNSDELAGKVAISIMTAKAEIKRPGWQRATDYDEADLRKQIMDLMESNKKLQQELEVAKMTITTDIAFEDCVYNIEYYYYDYNMDRIYSTKCMKLTSIFKTIATEMMDVMIVESSAASAIGKMIKHTGTIILKDSQIVKVILNQLRGLGLIQSKWNENNNVLYWGLTAKGTKVRDEMILIKKETESQ